ncbi:VanW family protein [Sporosarcina luteola]|uniref:VanW family protein n=1 Tax=Sporosarcina luteola TaxID=582850 RepID=UPI00203D766A|nr:VanW family protein [Sporosarcina luteola]MCM3744186.1 VanW family protein [Sporosarcina luteola]
MKKWIVLFVLLCSIGMVGCQQQSETEQHTNSTETPAAQPAGQQETSKQTESTKQPVAKTEIIPAPIPVINIIDPTSDKLIHTLTPIDLGYEMDIAAYIVKIEQLAKELARGIDGKAGYDQRMVLDKLDEHGNLIKGKPQVLLRESILVERIMEASAIGGDIELPIEITESGYAPEDIAHLEEVAIASYTTYFNPTDASRNKNIELSAVAINKIIVGKGDQFSFNTVVGPRDEANGYQPAPEIINKKRVMGIGGGICQTSSTLFNAVDQLRVKYIERHHHSLDIGYVPKGRDATVSYGGLDFRFQNTASAPFLIKAIYGDNYLTIEIRTAEKYVDAFKSN